MDNSQQLQNHSPVYFRDDLSSSWLSFISTSITTYLPMYVGTYVDRGAETASREKTPFKHYESLRSSALLSDPLKNGWVDTPNERVSEHTHVP